MRRVAALLLLLGATTLGAQDTTYDVVIRNGRVLDGEGNPWILADVAIKDGRFAKIGKVAGHGKREIDARGKYVSPGWIDMMDQSGAVLRRNGLAENKLQEGVTTAIGGEGGTPRKHALLNRMRRRLPTCKRADSLWPWRVYQRRANVRDFIV